MSEQELFRAAREAYPERRPEPGLGALERLGRTLWSWAGRRRAALGAPGRPPPAVPEGEADLPAASATQRRRLGSPGEAADARARLLALACRAAVLGGQPEPSAETRRAAWAMLAGAVADLPPGADPVTAAVLAGAVAAGRGLPVHLLAADEPAAAALADRAAALLPRLGLTAAGIGARTPEAERRAAHAADLVCLPLAVAAFDYLRDRVRMGRRLGPLRHRMAAADPGSPLRGLVMRGLGHAYVLDADALMVDRAHAPLVLREDPGAAEPAILARTSLPDFLGRYLRLGACAPAAGLSARDFRRLYGMPVVGTAPAAPPIGGVFATREEKWEAIAARAADARRAGRAVLVGIAAGDADGLAAALEARGLSCRRPGAGSPDPADAVLVLPERYGAPPLPEGPACLVLAQGFPGARLDGRLAAAVRRRVPEATCEGLFSLDDEVMEPAGPAVPGDWLPAAAAAPLRRWLYRRAQARAGRRETEVRVGLVQYDRHLDNVLAFAGEG
ncbi:MAG: hypothetical protein JNK22_04675 [Rhodocyclaceae bacterium]|nr:hypothetical protein [Rhodocyclaceae bacterium]